MMWFAFIIALFFYDVVIFAIYFVLDEVSYRRQAAVEKARITALEESRRIRMEKRETFFRESTERIREKNKKCQDNNKIKKTT